MKIEIVVLPGDGIGPEVIAEAMKVLRAIAHAFGHEVVWETHRIGWEAIQNGGDPLPDSTLQACLSAKAVLLGAVGHPEAERSADGPRPEAGLLRLRRELGCYANLRPARMSPHLIELSPLRPNVVCGTDLIIVRELAGGVYYGGTIRDDRARRVSNAMTYSAAEIERVARVAFELARRRRGDIVSVDKANVLAVSKLWRSVVDQIRGEYRSVNCRHMLIDRAAMELVFRPVSFDVVLTPNLFGDILSDQAAALTGSIGMLGSASLGGRSDLYEPVHGSAPDLAGRDVANPAGAIFSVAMMLRETFRLREEADAIEEAVESALADGLRTGDIAAPGSPQVGTRAFGDAVAERCASGAGRRT